tara:strand:+ start:6033 stop:7382 length:1350 start_codon:yes stop_codon:yes gene_type:complete
MGKIELIMPKMGESVAEATIIKWLKNVGDAIEIDETVVEIATDKVDSEIPSIAKGILKEKRYQENDIVKVGEVIAIIEDDTILNVEKDISTSATTDQHITSSIQEKTDDKEDIKADLKSLTRKDQELNIQKQPSIDFQKSNHFFSPLVKNIAKKENISHEELTNITGTGKNSRLTKKDLLNYIEQQRITDNKIVAESKFTKTNKQNTHLISSNANIEIVEMDRMRKIIAKHMIDSKSISAHVTSFVETDVSKIVEWRQRIKKKFIDRENEKITYTPIIFESIIKAIIDFPMINISVDGDNIIKHKNINLGMAAALPNGNLIVPVIKNAQEKNILGLTKSVNNLAKRARENQLHPDEISGGTFTVTNVGSFGSIMGTPIINQPQVAILALGKIQKKPTVIETEFGDTIGIRSKMFLSLSYDHRVIDGALGSQFLKRIADYLESFDISREI